MIIYNIKKLPIAPKWTMFDEKHWINGFALLTVISSPPIITVNVPLSAPPGPPDTGAVK